MSLIRGDGGKRFSIPSGMSLADKIKSRTKPKRDYRLSVNREISQCSTNGCTRPKGVYRIKGDEVCALCAIDHYDSWKSN